MFYIFLIENIAINRKFAVNLLKFHTDFELHSGFAKICDFDDFPIFKKVRIFWPTTSLISVKRPKLGPEKPSGAEN